MGNRVDYNCPGCGRQVWAYSYYAGNMCWKCPGTLWHPAVKTLPPTRVAETVVTTIANAKTNYKCPRCYKDVWAYGQFAGQTCWNCKGKNPLMGAIQIFGQVAGSASLTAGTCTLGKTTSATVNLSCVGMKYAETAVQSTVRATQNLRVSKSKKVPHYIDEVFENQILVSASIYGSIIQGDTYGNIVDFQHWWLLLQTRYKNQKGIEQKGYYIAQLNFDILMLKRCKSSQQVHTQGKNSAGNRYSSKNYKDGKNNISRKISMKDVKAWISNSNDQYHLLDHNCQIWAKQLLDWIKKKAE